MATQTFSLPEANCPAGQRTVSPSTVINSNPKQILIRLTSTQWASKSGQGALAKWGVERSPDGSAWDEWIYQPDIPFGLLGKDGGLPAVSVAGGAMVTMVGYRVRLFADVTGVAINLGADITVTT